MTSILVAVRVDDVLGSPTRCLVFTLTVVAWGGQQQRKLDKREHHRYARQRVRGYQGGIVRQHRRIQHMFI